MASKVLGHLNTGIAGSNPAHDMVLCRVFLCYVAICR
jgi:hypothetical protein